MKKFASLLVLILALFTLPSCKEPTTFKIVAGSETRPLAFLLEEFGRANNVRIVVEYKGSLEIQKIAESSNSGYDAIWPASSIWLSRSAKNESSIMRTPVILGVRQSLARSWGWTEPSVAVSSQDILKKIEEGARFGQTSATQSNSGAQTYLAFLSALSEKENLTVDDLKSKELQEKLKVFLSGIKRSSGSSGWLGDFVVENPKALDLVFNYEATLLSVNQRLRANNEEVFHLIYPTNALSIADHPLAFLPNQNLGSEAMFEKLKSWLLENPQQRRIGELGWRTGRIGLEVMDRNLPIWSQNIGINFNSNLTPQRLPNRQVIDYAFMLYQVGGFKRPSHTIILYDLSGSMKGSGVTGAREAFATLLNQRIAAENMLAAGPDDILEIVPFSSSNVKWERRRIDGNDPNEYQALLRWVESITPNGGTDFYTPLSAVLPELEKSTDHLTAIILLTDGQSETNNAPVLFRRLNARHRSENVPIFSIVFGEADTRQLTELANSTGARVFDGRKDIGKALRESRGYN